MTIDLTLIRTDLNNGMTISEVCTKYQVTFRKLCNLCHGYERHRQPEKGPTGQRYIYKRPNGGFIINKRQRDKMLYYGEYKTLEDAVKMRDYLIMHGWYRNRVPRIRRELGV